MRATLYRAISDAKGEIRIVGNRGFICSTAAHKDMTWLFHRNVNVLSPSVVEKTSTTRANNHDVESLELRYITEYASA